MITRMVAITRAAIARPQGSPGAPPSPPAIQFTATPIKEMPIRSMAVPVTTGAKSEESLLKSGAMNTPKIPEMIVAPKMPGRPRAGLEAMAMLGATETKVTPIMTGSRTPTGPKPMH